MIKPPPSAIRAWNDICGQFPCIATGSQQVHLHHPVGREYKVKCPERGTVQIGRVFQFPVWYVLHDTSSDHGRNVTHYRHEFVKKYGRECDLFKRHVDRVLAKGFALPFDDFYIDLIMETGR